MSKFNRGNCLRVLLGIGTLILTSTTPAFADKPFGSTVKPTDSSASVSPAMGGLQLMPANIEIFGTVQSIDSIKGIVKVQGRSYHFAPEMSIHKADGTITSRHNMRLKKGMKIAIRHSVRMGRKTYIAEEIWVKK